jgi:hypothetical protein
MMPDLPPSPLFFRAVWGFDPFPWRAMLAERLSGGSWPRALDLPTAAGETECIDLALYALASQVVHAAFKEGQRATACARPRRAVLCRARGRADAARRWAVFRARGLRATGGACSLAPSARASEGPAPSTASQRASHLAFLTGTHARAPEPSKPEVPPDHTVTLTARSFGTQTSASRGSPA